MKGTSKPALRLKGSGYICETVGSRQVVSLERDTKGLKETRGEGTGVREDAGRP